MQNIGKDKLYCSEKVRILLLFQANKMVELQSLFISSYLILWTLVN
jgi:hypothetical protein